MLNTVAVIGYALPLEAACGSTVQFKLSSERLASAQAEIVKIRCGDPDPSGPGVHLQSMPSPIDGTVALSHQPIHAGSCAVVDDAPVIQGLGSFSIGCWIWPTRLEAGAQTVLARWRDDTQQGWRLGLDAQGRMSFSVGVQGRVFSVATTRPLMEREWAFVGASLDLARGELRVFQLSLDRLAGRDRSDDSVAAGPTQADWPSSLALTFAAHLRDDGAARHVAGHFNGKIDRPRLHAGVLGIDALRASAAMLRPERGDADLVGAWDFADAIGSDTCTDRGPHGLHGVLRNAPTRAVTGANWAARTPHWTEAPDEYGAIHFHDDDIDDCGWDTNLSLTIPADWPSGFYSLRLTANDADGGAAESHVPFFIGAQPGKARARLAFVASTATFLAYSNSAIRLDLQPTEAMLEQLLVLGPDDAYLQEHRELGLSTYDTHGDGSGWCYASAARPILNMRPYGGGYYQMDTRVIDWLDSNGIAYDIITDEAIHRHGAQLLAGYGCVVTGCHPEYYTQQMLDAFETYQADGGRHIYLGGNGFYWRTAFHPSKPGRIEIRRGLTGTRTWEGEPGENGLSTTGEPSGLWRSNGRPPQRLVGVGFDAQVFDRGCAYRRLPASHDPRAAFIFEGVGAEEVIGDFGLRGGAGGHEIDRVDMRLGSPPNLLHVATADAFGSGGLATPEEFGVSHRGLGGDQNSQIRADMTFFPTARGGAVFTTGSIAWGMAFAHRGYDNNVSRITGNVLRRFLDPAPFDGFGADEESR
ncbi:MAG: N,N-dimethylformamidase beta subunit family domain-containing protein [Pseudomonadota bacterium]